MFQLFPPKVRVSIIAFVITLLVSGAWVLGGGLDLPAYVKNTARATSVLGALIVLLSIPSVFAWLTRTIFKGTFLDVGGLYTVTMDSNWPVIAKLVAARDEVPSSESDSAAPDLMTVTGRAVIRPTLYDIHVEMKFDGTKNRSITTSAMILRTKDGHFHLSYQYRQDNDIDFKGQQDNDHHEGAARLVRQPSSENGYVEWQGSYWTNRNYQKGMNTAGRLCLSRIDPTQSSLS